MQCTCTRTLYRDVSRKMLTARLGPPTPSFQASSGEARLPNLQKADHCSVRQRQL